MSNKFNTKDSYKVGVISDTHGLLRPEVVTAFQGCDLIIHAGDIGDPVVLKELGKIAPVKAIRGNMDIGEWAFKLPATDIIEVGDVLIYMLHNVYRLDIDPSSIGIHMVISGHAHCPSKEFKKGVLFLNPGTAGPFKPPISIARLAIKGTSVEPHFIEINN